MRYLALVVGLAMIVGGVAALVIGIIRIVRFMAELGVTSFECSGSACDVLGDAPLLIGGGVTLLVLGSILASVGTAATAARTFRMDRWSSTMRMNRLSGPNQAGPGLSLTHGSTSSGTGQVLPAEAGPLVESVLQGLRTAGFLPDLATAVQHLDPVTGQPVTSGIGADGRSRDDQGRDLRATGTLGRVVVQSFRELPVGAVAGQLFELDLQVTPEDRPGYRVRHLALVPSRWSYRISSGASFPAWVDAADPSRLLIEWERS